jgi:hypothetical protein
MTEIEELRARLAALEAKVDPPAKPEFVRTPMPRYDPTEAMSPAVRLTGREEYKKQTIEEANAEFRQSIGGVGTLKPLAEFLSGGRPAEPAPVATATTVPLGQPPGIAVIDAIATGFEMRERAEEIAKQLQIARTLKGG